MTAMLQRDVMNEIYTVEMLGVAEHKPSPSPSHARPSPPSQIQTPLSGTSHSAKQIREVCAGYNVNARAVDGRSIARSSLPSSLTLPSLRLGNPGIDVSALRPFAFSLICGSSI
jgi:hypothetical protein